MFIYNYKCKVCGKKYIELPFECKKCGTELSFICPLTPIYLIPYAEPVMTVNCKKYRKAQNAD